MRRGKKWSLLWILIPIVVVGAFLLLSTRYLLDPNIYRNILQKSLTTALDREVSIGKAKIDLWGGVGMAFEDFRVRDRSLAFDLLQSKRLILKVKLLPLLKREIKWRRIVVDRPTLHVVRDKNGQFNIFSNGPLTGETQKETQKKILEALSSLVGCSLTIRGGEIFLSDESLGDSPLKTEIRSFNLELSKVSYGKTFPFRINGKIIHSMKEGPFSIHGTLQDIPEDMDFSKGRIEAEVKMKGVETLHFWPYLETVLPMKRISGTLDLHAQYRGDFRGPFKASAKIRMKDVLFDYPRVFSFILEPKWLNLDFEAEYDTKNFKVPRFFIELPEVWIKAKGRIYDIGSEEMGMEAEASTRPFDIAEGKKFIPFRIIVPAVSDHLFRSEGKGSFQAVSVKLSGKMPEIDHCDQPANAHVLSIEAKLDGAQLKLPWDFPPLENLKGQVLFQKGHLYLKEVNGRIFHSTLEKVNATFSELLHVPTLQLDCQGKLDLTDLPGLSKTEGIPEEFSRTLSSIHILSGGARLFPLCQGDPDPPHPFPTPRDLQSFKSPIHASPNPIPDPNRRRTIRAFPHRSQMVRGKGGVWSFHSDDERPLETRREGSFPRDQGRRKNGSKKSFFPFSNASPPRRSAVESRWLRSPFRNKSILIQREISLRELPFFLMKGNFFQEKFRSFKKGIPSPSS